MNDDIVFQPGSKDESATGPKNNSERVSEAMSEAEGADNASKVFDFSSDLNISVVNDDAANKVANPFKPITVVLPKKPVAPVTPRPTPSPAAKPTPTLSATPINVLNTPQAPLAPAAPAVAAAQNTTSQPNPDWPFAAAQKAPVDITRQPVMPPSFEKKPSPIFVPTPTERPSLASLSAKKPDLTNKGNPVLKNLRTYEGDIAEVLAHRGTSSVAMAIAESKKRGAGETIKNNPAPQEKPFIKAMTMRPPAALTQNQNQGQGSAGVQGGEGSTDAEGGDGTSNTTKIIIVLVCIILIGAGATFGYYLFSKSPLAQVTKTQPTTKVPTYASLVPSDVQAAISIDGASSGLIIQKIKGEMNKPQTAGSIKEIVVTKTENTVGYRVSGTEMLVLLKIPMPNIISRTLTPEWMLGSYADTAGNKIPFVVLTTNLFQNAFAGMLGWETTMADDIKNLLSATTSSSYLPTPRGTFRDEIIKNKDIRAFVDGSGTVLFEYSFVDNKTLIITTNDTAMNAVISRLESKAFMR